MPALCTCTRQPWAYQAREFLRKKVIGKQIKFQLEGKNPAGREFAAVWTQDETNLSVALVAAGLAKAKTVSENNQPSWYGDLMAAEEEATAAELGIWTKDVTKSNATVRQVCCCFVRPPVEAMMILRTMHSSAQYPATTWDVQTAIFAPVRAFSAAAHRRPSPPPLAAAPCRR